MGKLTLINMLSSYLLHHIFLILRSFNQLISLTAYSLHLSYRFYLKLLLILYGLFRFQWTILKIFLLFPILLSYPSFNILPDH